MLHKSFKLKGSFLVRKELNHEDDILSFNIAQTCTICTALNLKSGMFKHTISLLFTLVTLFLLLYTLGTFPLLLTKVLNKEGRC